MRHKKDNISTASPDDVARFAGDGGEPAPDTTEGGPETVESLRAECDQLKDKLLRAQAECANIPKRLHQQHAEALRLAGMGIVRELLPIIDNFERSIASMTAEHENDTVIAGIKLIADQLAKILRDHGVEPIEAVGKPFDPLYHEAMMSDPSTDRPPGTVTNELQRGYTMHGRVLRPARVTVAAEPNPPEADTDQGTVE